MGKGMKYLVLGASSFYGSNFLKFLKARGEDAEGLSRPAWNLGGTFMRADIIINFASRNLVPESWDHAAGYMWTNAAMTTELFEQVRNMNILRFVHVSTPEVYGNTPYAVREDHPFNPSTPYAASRAAADMLLATYQRAYGMNAVITRTANIYGVGQPDHRFISNAFKTLRSGGKLVLDGGGNTLRGWIHVQDACEATYKLCKEGSPGVYHIAPQELLTIHELASMICEQLGIPRAQRLETGPERRGKDLAYIMSTDKLRGMGWTERISLEQGLAEYGN